MATPPSSEDTRKPEGPPPTLPAFPGQEEDFLFKLQMGVANAFYGYWRHALGVAVAILVAVFLVGTWQNHVRDQQRDQQAEIAKVARTMRAGFEKHAEDEAAIKAQATEGGKRFAALAAEADGASATYAWIRAAQAYKIAEDQQQEIAAWRAADETQAKGALGWSAALGLARALADSGDVDGAATVLRREGAQRKGYEAELALYELGRAFELAGRPQDGIAVLEDFQQRFPESTLGEQVQSSLARMRGQG